MGARSAEVAHIAEDRIAAEEDCICRRKLARDHDLRSLKSRFHPRFGKIPQDPVLGILDLGRTLLEQFVLAPSELFHLLREFG